MSVLRLDVAGERSRGDGDGEAAGALQDRLGALNDLATWSRLVKLARLKGMEPPSVDVPAELAAAQETADRIAALPAFWESTLQR